MTPTFQRAFVEEYERNHPILQGIGTIMEELGVIVIEEKPCQNVQTA